MSSGLSFEWIRFFRDEADDQAPKHGPLVTEAIFDIARFVEAAFQQGLDPVSGGGALHRGKESLPFGHDLSIRRQAGDVDEALRVGDGLAYRTRRSASPARRRRCQSSASGRARLT